MKKLLSLVFAFSLITSNLFGATLEVDNMEYSSDANAQAAYVSNAATTLSATGGTITYPGDGSEVHTFTSGGNFVVTGSGNVQVLVVGGGGPGGNEGSGGGGGGGGVVYNSSFAVTAQTYSVTVGSGGTPKSSAGDGAPGTNGGNSVFSSITATGGGAGAGCDSNGAAGGCGGGAGENSGGAGGSGSQGYKGGSNPGGYNSGGGGGGGMGSAGVNASGATGGNGGSGYASTIYDGSTRYYGGGGGGGAHSGSTAGTGTNGGGNGSNSSNGSNGTSNTGGGGGGAGYNGTNMKGGSGGSGIVIIRFTPSTVYLQSYSESTIKTQGSYALKAVAAITGSLNKTLTKTLSPNSNLTGVNKLRISNYSLRTGSNYKIGLHDTGGTTTEFTPNIATSNTWQTDYIDLSVVSDANKDNIDQLILTITNADSANTFYLDYFGIFQGGGGGSYTWVS